MSIQTQLFSLLAGQTAAATRIYPLVAPADVVAPYIVYQRISAVDEVALSGATGLTNTRMQIDIYADTYAVADSLARQVADLMAGWSLQNTQVITQDLYESEVNLYRVQVDYSIWHP